MLLDLNLYNDTLYDLLIFQVTPTIHICSWIFYRFATVITIIIYSQ